MSMLRSLGSLLLLMIFVNGYDVNRDEREMVNSWQSYKSKHGLTYHSLEERSRYSLFRRNSLKIREHNRLHAQGRTTYTMAINKFAHMTDDEYRRSHLGYNSSADIQRRRTQNQPEPSHNVIRQLASESDVPDSYSYVALNQVTPIRNQYDCGSCWSFTAVSKY